MNELDEEPFTEYLVDCPACGGEGRDIRMASPSRMNVDPEIDYGRCRECRGTGEIWIETEPLTVEDLE